VGGQDREGRPIETAAQAVALFRTHVAKHLARDIRATLRGKNLACWCKIGDPCHRDVLLDIANRD
jgi:hypothetical protein